MTFTTSPRLHRSNINTTPFFSLISIHPSIQGLASMHMQARGKLATSPIKSDTDMDIIERIRQIEAVAILRGGSPDPSWQSLGTKDELVLN